MGCRKALGNRWERPIDDVRTAAVDLLIPACTSSALHTEKVADVVTTEVPGLAEASLQSPVTVDATLTLGDSTSRNATVVLPDAAGMLMLKAAAARTVRDEA